MTRIVPPPATLREAANVVPARPSRPRPALAVAMLGFAAVALDAQVTNVALPAIHRDLGGGLAGLQWIVTGYTLMFSALLLFGGTLSDRIGARRAYRSGMVLFVVASAACGLAPSLPFLIVARLVQGTGAALVTPTSLALLREAYEDGSRRAKAVAYWALGGSAAAAAGPILGGALAQVDWRLIFFLNLPVGALAIGILSRVADSPRRVVRFDWTGQVSAVVGLAALTFGVIEGGSLGFASPEIISAFGVAVASFSIFLGAQARGQHPMVPLSLFRARPVSISLCVALITMMGFYGLVFLQSLYFQQLRGESALHTGLLFLPMTALVTVLNPLVAHIAARFGPLVPIIGGQFAMAAGLVALAVAPAHTPTIVVALLMIPVGVGGSFTVPPIASLLLDSVAAQQAGTASGVLNTFRQLGGSFGVAVFGAVVAAQAGLLPGLRISYLVTAVLLAVTAAASLALRSSKARLDTNT
jgi:MFS transporter, DHA2 family, methylenomycin A resistance protein